MNKAIVVVGWLFSVILALSVGLTTLSFLRQPQRVSYAHLGQLKQTNRAVLSSKDISDPILGITTQFTTDDARPILIAEFLASHNSPLIPYDYWGNFLTELADTYSMDYRLLPSIAMQESNLCKKIPEGSYNCLGLGIHSRGTWGFESFEANFQKAAEILRSHYLDEGLITPDQIQDKYTPKSNGSWEFAVNKFMDKLETADF